MIKRWRELIVAVTARVHGAVAAAVTAGVSVVYYVTSHLLAVVAGVVCGVLSLKVYSNELFLFQLTNDLCRSFTKTVIILLFSKAVFIKKNFVISIFCAKNRITIKVLF